MEEFKQIEKSVHPSGFARVGIDFLRDVRADTAVLTPGGVDFTTAARYALKDAATAYSQSLVQKALGSAKPGLLAQTPGPTLTLDSANLNRLS